MIVLESFVIFVISVIITWVAGTWLARCTDAIDTHFKLGSAFGGLILLGIAGSLPEIAVIVSAALAHRYDVIIGNLIGGIAIQTVVLVLLDAAMKEKRALSYAAASLSLVLEANMVILVTVIALLGIRTPILIHNTNFSLTSLAILVTWIFGTWLIYKARFSLPWKSEAIEATPGRTHHERRSVVNHPSFQNKSIQIILLIFIAAAIVTLAAGVGLQESGTALANYYGIGAGLFAATFIAFATALPEISTGIASIRMKDYQLAFSDIFGGNAFMPALFIVGDIISGQQVLKYGTSNDVWFAAFGILLTAIYATGLIVRPRKIFWRLGTDSLAVLIIYIIGIMALALSPGKI